MNYTITIKEGKEKQLLRHHPWVFSGAIKKVEPQFNIASWADVYTEKGVFIAKGWYDEKSHIVLHLLSWNEKEKMGEAFVKRLVREAILRRRNFFSKDSTTNAFRLIHGEADFLPGFAVDAYASNVRIILSSRFAAAFLQSAVEEIDSLIHPNLIIATSDKDYASSEGLSERNRYFIGAEEKKMADDAIGPVTILENGIYYEIPGTKGQKSGFYVDQRDNRVIAEEYAQGKTCLDVCSYTGAFTLHLLKGGAKSVKAIDSSESALRHLLYQTHLNEEKGTIEKKSREKVEILSGDCFELLRAEEGGKYDLIVLDPPKLAKTKGALENAMKAYKDLNRVAMEKIKNDGILITFSCSGALSREDFRTVLSWSAKDARVEAEILRTLSQGEDHPIRLSCPESEYLKGYVLRIIK